ncbi:CidA/LrgA family protein [Vibrio genomosp. F10]|uniref:Uncharacterized protein n=2 Tax=Vibrio genomosp. F10 TaxID=723171 RepID=A0A1B9QXF2_9VIBR|nr:CidA/LrgA family protein [Vibrio genomosp. F10]OCH74710.1 hypothetical protein A6E14_12220 [Vibrio genomosp. F10]OEE32982.1 hypothetical protein A1QO_11020 [Vibrio genomosp. F10 str. ZF-129]OEE96799.1 hypothetical protein A1QM_16160 [Vibrio genomosp. F10 str. 9ZC157]OEF09625.1 hypothetical protein A1QI_13680 [Vibrio genomosp. F10 str. 9ZB36]
MAMKLAKYLVSMLLILVSLLIGNTLQSLLNTAIPGSIFGMLILFSLLASGLVSSEWVKSSATLLIRYMILLFVPISVGLMLHFDTLIENALPILASTIGATFIVLVVLGYFLDRLLKKGNK